MTHHHRDFRFLGLRSKASCVAVLAVVATAYASWTIGHALAHELEHDSHSHHDIAASGPESAALTLEAAHGHGHTHPDLAPVVLTQKVQQAVALALPARTPELVRPSGCLRLCVQDACARAAPGLTAPLGPRAPPIA